MAQLFSPLGIGILFNLWPVVGLAMVAGENAWFINLGLLYESSIGRAISIMGIEYALIFNE